MLEHVGDSPQCAKQGRAWMIPVEDGDKSKEVKTDRNVAFGDLVQGIAPAWADIAVQQSSAWCWSEDGQQLQ